MMHFPFKMMHFLQAISCIDLITGPRGFPRQLVADGALDTVLRTLTLLKREGGGGGGGGGGGSSGR